MNKIVNPFVDFLPRIDLHGMDRVCAKIKTEEFINDNIKLKNKEVVIIHGKGMGIVKDEVYKTLKNNKNVISYKLDGFNIGQTIVNLKVD
jgi:DNA mismatch repair protein MutS2